MFLFLVIATGNNVDMHENSTSIEALKNDDLLKLLEMCRDYRYNYLLPVNSQPISSFCHCAIILNIYNMYTCNLIYFYCLVNCLIICLLL